MSAKNTITRTGGRQIAGDWGNYWAGDNQTSPGAFNQSAPSTFRTIRTASHTVATPAWVFGNYHNTLGGGGEDGSTPQITIKASLEYPVGNTPVALTFDGGATTATLDANDFWECDPVVGVTITAADVYRIYVCVTACAGGAKNWTGVISGWDPYAGLPQAQTGDQTATGLSSPTIIDANYSPVAITGTVSGAPKVIGLLGDSIFQGIGDTTSGTTNFGYGQRAAVAASLIWLKFATAGDKATWFAAGFRSRIINAGCDGVIENFGINDNNGGSSAGQIETALTNLAADFTISVGLCTITPYASSTDSYTTAGGQTAFDAVAQAVNAWLLSTPPAGTKAVFDACLKVSDLGNHAIWKTDGVTANLETVDGLHPSPAGHADAATAISFTNFFPPSAPTSLTATANSSSQITITWTAAAGGTSQKVYRGPSSGTETLLHTIGDGTTTTYVDTGLSASTTYYYKITASNAGGESDYSNEANATTSVPAGSGGTIGNVGGISLGSHLCVGGAILL